MLLAAAFPTEVVDGVKGQAVRKEQKVKPCSVKPMEVVGDVNTWAVLGVRKAVLNSVLPTGVERGVVMTEAAYVLLGAGLVFVFAMEVVKGAR